MNQPITESEILKNSKASGADILNELIKSSVHLLLSIYCKLFNVVLDTDIIPDSWSIGIIKPIYKNKGDPKCAENYRPKTILSCFGKLLTLIINNRLNAYAEKHDTIDWCQAGFRRGFSTPDYLFILKSLIALMQSQKKKVILLLCRL